MDPVDEILVTPAAPRALKRFIWKIQVFADTLRSRIYSIHSPLSIPFQVVSPSGLSSSWMLLLCRRNESEPRQNTLLTLKIAQESEGLDDGVNYFTCKARVDKRDQATAGVRVELNDAQPFREFGTYGQLLRALVDNDLWIRVDFEWFLPNPTPGEGDAAGDQILAGGREEVLENLGKLLETGQNSDFSIYVKDLERGYYNEIPVHKAILWAGSSVFRAMLDAEMSETQTGILEIADSCLTCIQILLKYMYTGKLEEEWKTVPEDMVHAAHKYDIPKLLDFLDRNLHCVATIGNVVKLRRVAKIYELEVARKKMTEFIMANIDDILD